jgi:hypothetical protein
VLLIFSVFCDVHLSSVYCGVHVNVVIICAFTFFVQCCDVRYGSSLPQLRVAGRIPYLFLIYVCV